MTLRGRILLLLLLPALVLAQWLGLVHGVSHARLAAPAAITSVAAAPAVAATGFDAVFAGHELVTCRVLDQLGHGGASPCVPAQLAPLAFPALTAPVVTGRLLVALAAGFQARAPPVLR
jgi:hypothetical protein